jgi:hypothetical protein
VRDALSYGSDASSNTSLFLKNLHWPAFDLGVDFAPVYSDSDTTLMNVGVLRERGHMLMLDEGVGGTH